MKRLALVRRRKWGWFLVDKVVAGGLDDWKVIIADIVASTAKPTSLRVWLRLGTRRDRCFVGQRCAKGS